MPLRDQVRQGRAALAVLALVIVLTGGWLAFGPLPAHALALLNRGRAAAGVPALRVPAAYWGWSADRQLVWVINAERAARGLPLARVSHALNGAVAQGIATDADPNPNAYYPGVQQSESIWAWVPTPGLTRRRVGADLLQIDDLWVYQDGWSGASTSNIDCTSPHALGCWGHRDVVLGDVPGTTLVVVPGVATHWHGADPGVGAAAIFVWTTVPTALR